MRTLPMTLQEVAKRARVSPATVSRVLNHPGRVKEAVRARVLKAMDELNYRPNVHARALARGGSRTIGLIVSNLRNPFFLDIFQALESDAHAKGFDVVVANTDYQSEQLLKHVQLMHGRRVAGLAVIVSEMDPAVIADLVESGLPIVFYDVGVAARKSVNVRTDYALGIRRVVETLYSLGHRSLAFIGHHTTLAPLQVRQRAFADALRECCGDATPVFEVADDDSPTGGLHATRQLFATGARPTGIVCVNDFVALGVMRALREMGLAVPGDISVVGCDNISLSAFACPPLTTINIPREKIGHIVSSALMSTDDSPSLWGRDIVIEPDLIIRDSTGPPPIARRQA